MRRLLFPLFSLLVLYAAATPAQITVSSEVVSDPLPSELTEASPVPAVAMAKDRTGVVIAWSTFSLDEGGDRIFVARLDATAHIAGSIHSVPTATSGAMLDQLYPSVAPEPTGDGFVLAWSEHSRPNQFQAAVYCQLDSDLNASRPSIINNSNAINSPTIVRSGKTVWITEGSSAWQIMADGSINGPLNAGLPASDMTLATDFPQLVAGQRVLVGASCSPKPGCFTSGHGGLGGSCNCLINQYSYLLQFVALYSLSAGKTYSFGSEAEPAIQSDGRDELIVWFRGTQETGGDVVAIRLDPSDFASFPQAADASLILGSFGPDSGMTRPDIATDGERYVAVWRTAGTNGEHNVVGASIDRAGNVLPLSIATSLADERDPSVIAVGEGRFLVAYEKDVVGERRLAGRFVTFESRSRATH